MRFLKNCLIIIAVFLIALYLTCSLPCDNAAGDGSQTGNAFGIIYNPNGSRAAQAKVYIIPVNHNPLTGPGVSSIDSTITNDTGAFEVDSLPQGYYNILGSGDSGVSFNDSVLIQGDTTNENISDTLRDAGSLSGVVRLQPGDDSRTILILVFGTQTWTAPIDSVGNFTIAIMAEGTYQVRILSTLDDYGVLDTNLSIQAGTVDTLTDTIFLPFTGIPVPQGLTLTYDTLKQIVTLTWNACDTNLVKGYNTYRKHSDSDFVKINTALFTDTTYSDSFAIQDETYEYKIKAVDKSDEEGKYSGGVGVVIIPTSVVTTFLTLHSIGTKNDSASLNDTIRIILIYRNDTKPIREVSWYIDTIQNPVRKSTDSSLIGKDTLQIVWADISEHIVRTKVLDQSGIFWYDSIALCVIKDTPLVFAGNDTNVYMGSQLTLKGIAEQRFGKITKWEWSINGNHYIETETSDTSILLPNKHVLYYKCLLRATDDDNNVGIDTLDIQVGKEWTPVGNIGFSTSGTDDVQMAIYDSEIFVAFRDHSFSPSRATVMKFNGIGWEIVGTAGFSDGEIGEPCFKISNSKLYLVYEDYALSPSKATAMSFNGQNWTTLGSQGFSPGVARKPSIALDESTPYVTYSDGSNSLKAAAMKYDGNNWVSFSSEFLSSDTAMIGGIEIENGIVYTAFIDYANGRKATVFKYDGIEWMHVGMAGFSEGAVDWLSIKVFDNMPYVSFGDYNHNSSVSVMKYNGVSWEYVGDPGFYGQGQKPSLAVYDHIPYIAINYDDAGLSKATVLAFDEKKWTTVGNSGFSAGGANSLCIEVNEGIPYVAFVDRAYSDKATVMRLQ